MTFQEKAEALSKYLEENFNEEEMVLVIAKKDNDETILGRYISIDQMICMMEKFKFELMYRNLKERELTMQENRIDKT